MGASPEVRRSEQADGLFDGSGIQSSAAPGHADEFFEEARGHVDVCLSAGQRDFSPGHEEADVREAAFEGAQNLVCDAEDHDRVHVCGDGDAPVVCARVAAASAGAVFSVVILFPFYSAAPSSSASSPSY